MTSGVKPAFQGRSRQRRDELINAGLRMMCTTRFSDLSVADLTGDCGYSVGTFYSRFKDKESYFLAVQATGCQRMQHIVENLFAEDHWKTASSDEIFEKVVAAIVDTSSGELLGIWRESLVLSTVSASYWEPLRLSGIQVTARVLDLLSDRYTDIPGESVTTIKFGMQLVYSTINNAILNDPGPVKLHAPELKENLSRLLRLYVKLKPAAS